MTDFPCASLCRQPGFWGRFNWNYAEEKMEPLFARPPTRTEAEKRPAEGTSPRRPFAVLSYSASSAWYSWRDFTCLVSGAFAALMPSTVALAAAMVVT